MSGSIAVKTVYRVVENDWDGITEGRMVECQRESQKRWRKRAIGKLKYGKVQLLGETKHGAGLARIMIDVLRPFLYTW